MSKAAKRRISVRDVRNRCKDYDILEQGFIRGELTEGEFIDELLICLRPGEIRALINHRKLYSKRTKFQTTTRHNIRMLRQERLDYEEQEYKKYEG